MNKTGFRFLFFLDLMCCGFGGALLMFLMVASATPPRARSSEMVVIRCSHLKGAKAEVGIEYKAPGEDWQRPKGHESFLKMFAATSAKDSGAETCLILFEPLPGMWEFRPYLVDFPVGDKPAEPIEVTLEIYGQEVRRWRVVGLPRSLRHPGDTGAVVEVVIAPRSNQHR